MKKFGSKKPEQQNEGLELLPWEHGAVTVFLDAAEFLSICPTTTTLDLGRLTIEYVPGNHLVETESLNRYLQRYRDVAELGEVIATKIADDIYKIVAPRSVTVTAHFSVRGGISPTAVASRGEGA